MVFDLYTGNLIQTAFQPVSPDDLSPKRWAFNWQAEALRYDTYKLVSVQSRAVFGLISMEKADDYLYVSSIEREGYQKGKKQYEGVTQNLFAEVCLLSQRFGFEGSVAFDAKTNLVKYFERVLGAVKIGRTSRMIIDTDSAMLLYQILDMKSKRENFFLDMGAMRSRPLTPRIDKQIKAFLDARRKANPEAHERAVKALEETVTLKIKEKKLTPLVSSHASPFKPSLKTELKLKPKPKAKPATEALKKRTASRSKVKAKPATGK